ncbi:MAG: hypothetical protein LCH79_16555 [Proteobacteria bacterium]|nr:hypothetical protein [Pseudomonadota bacterium]
MNKKMTLTQYLAGIEGATTAEELEAAIQAPFKHAYHGRTWARISRARVERGEAICTAHPLGRFVPHLGDRRQLTVCGETYKVARGYNSTGVRYSWHYAKEFAVGVLMRNGLSQRAAHAVWDQWGNYPHRCLETIEQALAGGFADPVMNTLILSYDKGGPIRYTVEQNDADEFDKRATMPCPGCKSGTLFDWGMGFSSGFTFVNWHCNGCSHEYTEYVTPERSAQIRQPRVPKQATEAVTA